MGLLKKYWNANLNRECNSNERMAVDVGIILLSSLGGVLLIIAILARFNYQILKDFIDFFNIIAIIPDFFENKNIENFNFLENYSNSSYAHSYYYLRIMAQLVLIIFIIPTILSSLFFSVANSNMIGSTKIWQPLGLLVFLFILIYFNFISPNSWAAADGDFSGPIRPGMLLNEFYAFVIWAIITIIFILPATILRALKDYIKGKHYE